MREYTIYIWLGVWLFILPFLGIPGSWRETLLMLTALLVIGHALFLYKRSAFARTVAEDIAEKPMHDGEKRSDSSIL